MSAVCCSLYCCCGMWIQGSVLTHQGNVVEDGLCIYCEAEDPEGMQCMKRAVGQDGNGLVLLPYGLSPHIL